jgi:hypothetical protein
VTTSDDLAEAWTELHDATPPGWFVGTPSHHVERQESAQYAL